MHLTLSQISPPLSQSPPVCPTAQTSTEEKAGKHQESLRGTQVRAGDFLRLRRRDLQHLLPRRPLEVASAQNLLMGQESAVIPRSGSWYIARDSWASFYRRLGLPGLSPGSDTDLSKESFSIPFNKHGKPAICQVPCTVVGI